MAGDIKEYFDLTNSCDLDPDPFTLILDAKQVKIKAKANVLSYTLYLAIGISIEDERKVQRAAFRQVAKAKLQD